MNSEYNQDNKHDDTDEEYDNNTDDQCKLDSEIIDDKGANIYCFGLLDKRTSFFSNSYNFVTGMISLVLLLIYMTIDFTLKKLIAATSVTLYRRMKRYVLATFYRAKNLVLSTFNSIKRIIKLVKKWTVTLISTGILFCTLTFVRMELKSKRLLTIAIRLIRRHVQAI